MKYKYEMHAHTAEVSKCGHVSSDKAVRMYKKAGYSGIIFTDHFNEENLYQKESKSWNDKIDAYLSGYRKASIEGKKIDMDILWGLELRFTENNNDYLVYGVDESFLKEEEDLHLSNITKFMNRVKNRKDILVFQAHPFRKGCKIVDPLIVDGLEVFNGNPRHDSRNELAVDVAFKNHMLISSGSDFHRIEDLATGGILLPERISSDADLIRHLRALQPESLIKKEVVCV